MPSRFFHVLLHGIFVFLSPLPVLCQDAAPAPDLQTQLNQQAQQIAELRELLDGKVDNGTSKNDVKLSGRIHADYWGFPNHDSVIEGLEGGDPQDRIGFRRIRFGVAGNIAPNMYLVDGVVPRTKLTQVLAEVGDIGRQYAIVIANVFHAGDGNLHPCILFDEREPGALERATEASGEILRVCIAAGGTLSGEHGVGLEKKEYMPLVFTGEDMAAMQRVRDSFAPKNRLNPGKIFPDGEPYQPPAYRPSAGMSA